MKRIAAVVVLLFAVAAWAQTPAAKPGPEHKKLQIWIGDWTCEEEGQATPLGPAYTLTGLASAKPIFGGFFIEWDADIKGNVGNTKWHEIDGYDSVNKRYFWHWYGNDGSSQTVTYTIEGSKVHYSGTRVLGDMQAKVRGTIVFAPDTTSWTCREEMSVDGKTWMPNFENKFTKVKPASK